MLWKSRLGHKKTYTTFCLVVENNAYIDIKDHSNILEDWYLLEQSFKLCGSCFFNGTIEKLFFLILNECRDARNYVTNLFITITELNSFSTKFQINENLLIFLFEYNLSSLYSAYCQSYV